MPFTRERVVLLIISIIAIVFGVLLVIQYQVSQTTRQELVALKNDIWPTDLDNPFREPSKYVTRETYDSVRDRVFSCEPSLRTCKSDLERLREEHATTSRYFVMENGVMLVEESTDDVERLYRLEAPGTNEDLYVADKVIGSFPSLSGPSGEGDFSFERLSSGLYRFVVGADYIEAGESTTGYINPSSRRFIALSGSSSDFGLTVNTPEVKNAELKPHLAKDDCATSSEAVIDGISWDGEIEYRFPRPIRVECQYIEHGGARILYFFAETEVTASASLNTFSIRLETGGRLNVQLRGSDKPIFSLR